MYCYILSIFYQDNLEHMVECFESAVSLMDDGVDAWIWMIDFEGFGLRDMGLKLAKAFIHMTERHYPERLGGFVLLDAPGLFKGLWDIIKGKAFCKDVVYILSHI